MRINLEKFFFGVGGGKFLGFRTRKMQRFTQHQKPDQLNRSAKFEWLDSLASLFHALPNTKGKAPL